MAEAAWGAPVPRPPSAVPRPPSTVHRPPSTVIRPPCAMRGLLFAICDLLSSVRRRPSAPCPRPGDPVESRLCVCTLSICKPPFHPPCDLVSCAAWFRGRRSGWRCSCPLQRQRARPSLLCLRPRACPPRGRRSSAMPARRAAVASACSSRRQCRRFSPPSPTLPPETTRRNSPWRQCRSRSSTTSPCRWPPATRHAPSTRFTLTAAKATSRSASGSRIRGVWSSCASPPRGAAGSTACARIFPSRNSGALPPNRRLPRSSPSRSPRGRPKPTPRRMRTRPWSCSKPSAASAPSARSTTACSATACASPAFASPRPWCARSRLTRSTTALARP
ncbi:MAG: hypothetical protein BWZ02_02048 [Lentisphaerae bacterium ADurb.BinA184]|nr:MAG: hypothetical protein BWZ02_02048 [Lentisphaerae bacterium ADurb.BinA184]